MKNPIQPLYTTDTGTVRFKQNKIVNDLVTFGETRGFSLNDIARGDYTNDDRMQLAQLIGYSLSGYGSLSYVDDESYEAAEKMLEGMDERDARIAFLQGTLSSLRKGMKESVARLYGIHQDDLGGEDEVK
jgi:hypothetical protein